MIYATTPEEIAARRKTFIGKWRLKVKSMTWAVVVSFSRRRRRYERQGLLVEPLALAFLA